MWPSLVKMQCTELKLSCRNDPVVKNSIYSNGDLDLWPNDPKINRILPLAQGNHVAKFGKDTIYTELKLLCGNLCGRPPARHTQSHNMDHLEMGVWTEVNNLGLLLSEEMIFKILAKEKHKFSSTASQVFYRIKSKFKTWQRLIQKS
jgi:hypothetical protein